MSSFAKGKKALTILLAIFAAVCIAIALALTLPSERALAQEGDNDEQTSERTPVVTYIIGDDTVTGESGFTYDEATNTYTYKDHAAGWSAATAKSAELYNENEADANLVEIRLASDYLLASVIEIKNIGNAKVNVLIDLNGYSISRGLTEATDSGHIFTITDGTVEITDNSVSGEGKITGGFTSGSGGAIQIGSGSTLIISGGNITGNKAGVSGGAIRNAGTLIINGGNITDNSGVGTSSNGGAIYSSGGNITINGGKISGNSAISGGGIYGSNSSTIIMNRGEITNNTATAFGGALYFASNSVFTMNGGEISYNSSGDSGGAIHSSQVSIIINGGIISDNNAGTTGGAIVQNGNIVTVNDGVLSNNTATTLGGAIYGYNSATVNMYGGTISGNTAKTNGGGISISGSGTYFNMYGGKIIGNYAQTSGGGLHLSNTVTCISGGEISGNNAGTSYGAVWLYNGAQTIDMGGVIVIKDNTTGATKNDDGTFSDGTASNFDIRQTQKMIFIAALQDAERNKSEIHISCTVSTVITSGYAANNTDENGIVIDPSEYFISDNSGYNVILNAEGEVQFTNQGALEWSATGNDGTIADMGYGAAVTYSENKITGVSLTQNGTTVTDIKVTDSDGNEISDLSATPLTNAGTYYATATVKGVNTTTAEVKFTIVILPYNIEGKTTYTVTASGWTDGKEQYTAQYDGNNKALPSLTLQLNNADFAASNYTVTYEINGSTVTELKEVGEYTVVITGTGNYTGTVYAEEWFVITQNTDKSYTVVWQYYDGESWQTLSSGDAAFIYSGADYSGLVRIVLTADNETRYAYADGVTEYNLADGEDESNVTHGLTVGIAKDGETAVINAGGYTLTLNGTPNYTVAEADTANAVAVAKYDLSEITSESIDTVEISATLNNDTYSAQEKVLTLAASVLLSGNTVTLGTSGAEYSYTVKYINADGTETEVDSIILGGTYRIYITATGNNFEGTLGVVAEVVVNKANNAVTLSAARDWEYGTYDNRLHGVTGSATVLYDGTVAGTEQAYVYYTVQNSDGEAVNATLTRFTAFTDEVMTALNALGAGSYTVLAEVFETESYLGATRTVAFNVVKAVNRWIAAPAVSEWSEGAYNAENKYFYSAALYGNAEYTVTDADGNEITDLANAKAGTYTLTVRVAETENYTGLNTTVMFHIGEKASALTGGEIAGIVVMGVVIAGLAAAVVVLLVKRRKTV